MAPVCAFLRTRGVEIYPYLDDWLIVANTKHEATQNTQFTLDLLDSLGLCVNQEKSNFQPTQRIKFLGAILDSTRSKAFLPEDRAVTLVSFALKLFHSKIVSAFQVQRLLGFMAATVSVVAWARLHMRPLQLWLLRAYDNTMDAHRVKLSIPMDVKESLLWWTNPSNITQGLDFRPITPSRHLVTDASLSGWGAHCGDLTIQERWSPTDRKRHINVLELKAIQKALHAFQRTLSGHVVQIHTDNMAAVWHINKQGGTRSSDLISLTLDIWHWAIAHNMTLSAIHIAGQDNVLADVLSRSFVDTHEWQMNATVLAELFKEWGTPVIDLFASPTNAVMVRATPVLISSHTSPVKGRGEVAHGQRQRHTNSALVAKAVVVHSATQTLLSGVCQAATTPRPHLQGERSSSSPRHPVPRPHSLEDKAALDDSELPLGVRDIILAARKPATRESYASKWGIFSSFARGRDEDPFSAPMSTVLSFLFSLYEKGLKFSSLRVYSAAISASHCWIQGCSVFTHPLAKQFMKGMKNTIPPVRPFIPSWSLSVVLKALSAKPFDPLATTDLRLLTLKVTFLVAVTSVRRASELTALRMDPPYTVFHADKVVLRPDPTFLPKVVSSFHLGQDITLPTFFPSPTSPVESTLHTLDVKRALAFYLSRTASFRQSQRLFVCYGGRQKGVCASSQRIAKWIVHTIKLAYELAGLPLENKIRSHSARGVATSTAFEKGVAIPDLCRAATWSTPSTFASHYRLDIRARKDSGFGRAVLSAIL